VIRKIFNLYFSRDKNFARQIFKITGYSPEHLHFYHRAFTHKSLNIPQNSRKKENDSFFYQLNNERLEYLGDAILDAIMAEYLFKKYPTQDEGFLTQMRSKMVNRKILNQISSDMGLDIFLRERGTSQISQSMLGNTFEAFVGAVYLDLGYSKTKSFIIQRILKYHLDVHELENTNNNYKSILLEYCQKNQKIVQYELLEQIRSKNNREKFKIAVLIDNELIAEAEDFNKKSTEQLASKNALVSLGIITNIDANNSVHTVK
jgi:ribonuclease-3